MKVGPIEAQSRSKADDTHRPGAALPSQKENGEPTKARDE